MEGLFYIEVYAEHMRRDRRGKSFQINIIFEKERGYQAKKSKVFTREQSDSFLREASDTMKHT